MTSEMSQLSSRLREPSATKTVGLISDTHIPQRARQLPKQVLKIFEDVEFIVHAGDLVQFSVIDELEEIAPVLAVCGNIDGPDIRGKLPKINSVKVFEWKIGVKHDPGALFGIKKMREIAQQNGFNVLVYGHTHSSGVKWDGRTLFINPGSPTNPVPPFIIKPSVGLLKITKEEIKPELIQF